MLLIVPAAASYSYLGHVMRTQRLAIHWQLSPEHGCPATTHHAATRCCCVCSAVLRCAVPQDWLEEFLAPANVLAEEAEASGAATINLHQLDTPRGWLSTRVASQLSPAARLPVLPMHGLLYCPFTRTSATLDVAFVQYGRRVGA